jgi:hypothetical protein
MTDETKTGPVTDQEVSDWVKGLNESDQAELRRQALLKRAIDLAQPEKPLDLGSMTEAQFREACKKWGF